jgi:hypothetical protein
VVTCSVFHESSGDAGGHEYAHGIVKLVSTSSVCCDDLMCQWSLRECSEPWVVSEADGDHLRVINGEQTASTLFLNAARFDNVREWLVDMDL